MTLSVNKWLFVDPCCLFVMQARQTVNCKRVSEGIALYV